MLSSPPAGTVISSLLTFDPAAVARGTPKVVNAVLLRYERGSVHTSNTRGGNTSRGGSS